MSLKKTVAKGIIMFGLLGLLACKGNNVSETTSSSPTTSEIEQLVAEEHQLVLDDDFPKFGGINDGIYTELEKAGISTDITIDTRDKGPNAGIKEIILYEDGQQIKTKKIKGIFTNQWGFGIFTVKHQTPGTHTYHAEVIDKDDNRAKSKSIRINFSGKFTDTPPELYLHTYSLDNDGELDITARDKGDNKGLKEIILYEDNLKIERFRIKNKDYSKNFYSLKDRALKLGLSGKHIYHADVIDKGGNKTRSKVFSIDYKRK